MDETDRSQGYVTRSVRDGICEITFFHPKGNSLPRRILYSLAQEITDSGGDPTVKVILLRSEGNGAFCGGASFDELIGVSTLEQAQAFFSGFAKVILAMRGCPRFIVTRVHAKVVGGGVGLVAASDYAFASTQSAVRLSELAIGIGPFTIGPAVERRVGAAAFHDLAVCADWRSAEWGLTRGLYSEVHESLETLDAAIQGFLVKLCSFSQPAMKAVKKMVWEGTDHWPSLLEERVLTTSSLVLSQQAQDAIKKAKTTPR